MPRQRAHSGASTVSTKSAPEDQELGTMYDYLAKVILLGPSGCGKSCLLHRFVRGEWRVLSSQTIGVEFASKIIKVGTGARRKRIKLQLWDTAGQERFRSVTRSYYRGAAGAILVYDITSHPTFTSLPTFLADARALASPNLTLLLVGNKSDLSTPTASPGDATASSSYTNASVTTLIDVPPPSTASSANTTFGTPTYFSGQSVQMTGMSTLTASTATEGRAVSTTEAARWASLSGIPVSLETSALNGENVDEVFAKLARMILTKIELGEVDPDDPQSGIQYGDSGGWNVPAPVNSSGSGRRRRGGTADGWRGGVREWEEVFRDPGVGGGRRKKGCC